MDDTTVRGTEAQLALWDEEFRRREARLQTPGREPRFEAVLHVDELRVLLVSTRARLAALQTAPTWHHDLLTAEFERALKELTAAIVRRMPRP